MRCTAPTAGGGQPCPCYDAPWAPLEARRVAAGSWPSSTQLHRPSLKRHAPRGAPGGRAQGRRRRVGSSGRRANSRVIARRALTIKPVSGAVEQKAWIIAPVTPVIAQRARIIKHVTRAYEWRARAIEQVA